MTMVLIVMWSWWAGQAGGPSIAMQEFATPEACDAARAEVVARFPVVKNSFGSGTTPHHAVWCQPKGGTR